MLGFMIGTASLIGLIAVLRGGRHGHCHGGAWSRGGRGRGRFGHAALGWLFRRLDTSPGQEKELRAAAEDLRNEARALREELTRARSDLASALRNETFDEVALRDALEQHDARLARLRESVVQATARVHGALEPEQRGQLADLLSQGFGWRHAH